MSGPDAVFVAGIARLILVRRPDAGLQCEPQQAAGDLQRFLVSGNLVVPGEEGHCAVDLRAGSAFVAHCVGARFLQRIVFKRALALSVGRFRLGVHDVPPSLRVDPGLHGEERAVLDGDGGVPQSAGQPVEPASPGRVAIEPLAIEDHADQ
ncbi:MAG: hypothetical protein U0992_13515 [Planctomycetaceae bacterium]